MSLLVALGLGALTWFLGRGGEGSQLDNLYFLRDLPRNTWVPYFEGDDRNWIDSALKLARKYELPGLESVTGDWTRQGHAGLAYASDRGSLLVFGSDTHGENWDNRVHEFVILSRQWITHGSQSSQSTYRVDQEGRPVAGESGNLPWAMHTYDGVEYDPARKIVVMASRPGHNPATRVVSGIERQPIWLYDPEKDAWSMQDGDGAPDNGFFAAGAAYDEKRNVLMVFQGGVWELGPERRVWRRVSPSSPLGLEQNAVYDSSRGRFFVFGGTKATNEVWSYIPGSQPGMAGHWESHAAGGDVPPSLNAVPVAFDRNAGVFLLAVNDPAEEGDKGVASASTYIYDPDSNRFTLLPYARLPAVGMNYMMAWDQKTQAFLLVTGSWNTPVTVWALSLDVNRIAP